MRKAIYAAAAVLLFAGCEKTVLPGSGETESGKEITFGQPRVTATTRAPMPDEEEFCVFGRKYTGDFTKWSAGTDYMCRQDPDNAYSLPEGIVVRRVPGTDDENTFWRAEEKFYWPKDGSKLAFLAYAPADLSSYTLEGATSGPEAGFDNRGVYVNNYAPKTDVSYSTANGNPGEPLLYCDPVTDQTMVAGAGGKPQPVTISFKHALAKVGFTVRLAGKPAGATVRIHNLILTGYVQSGSFYQQLPDRDDTYSPTWVLGSWNGIAALTFVDFYDNFEVTERQVPTPFAYVIPQSFYEFDLGDQVLNKTILSFTYGIYRQDSEDPELGSLHLPLTEIYPEGEWKFEMGKEYTIDIVLNASKEELTFIPTVAEWETGGSETVTLNPRFPIL